MKKRKKLKIILGDLRHNTTGRHSISMPIGIGYIASYLFAQVGKENVEVRLYDDPDLLLQELDEYSPDIVGLANYCWNTELSRVVLRYAKRSLPSVTCIAGGPEFPLDPRQCQQYLSERKEIDFYVYREGEVAFAELVKKILTMSEGDSLKEHPLEGVMYISPASQEVVIGLPARRLTQLDQIPSPYTTGIMDQWFTGRYAPLLETARGCPFSCGYCYAGQTWCSPVARFSVERIKDELNYIAVRMKDYPGILLGLCDANFGMYARDETIALFMGDLQDKYHWPNVIDVTTGKKHYDRIIRIASQLHDRLKITCSVQSLNENTLEVIKRVNIPMEQYKQIQGEIKRKGMMATAELIIPMPQETKESYFESIRRLFEAGVDCISTYTTMLLKSTFLDSEECRATYAFKTKYRIVPRQFGEYAGEKCFEIEEVVVSTNTMSYDDYLECRGFAFVSTVMSSEEYDLIRRHIIENGLDVYEYLYELWTEIKSGASVCSSIYAKFIEGTKGELWESREDIYRYFSEDDNYEKLLAGELGDNLMRKYETEMFLEGWIPLIHSAYHILESRCPKEVVASLAAARRWLLACRNVSAVFSGESSLRERREIGLEYDVSGWYRANDPSRPLMWFRRNVDYCVYYDSSRLKKILRQAESLYGKDKRFVIGKTLNNWSVKEFWAECETRA